MEVREHVLGQLTVQILIKEHLESKSKRKFSVSAMFCFVLFFFLRKITPELTAANPPLFAEEDWP